MQFLCNPLVEDYTEMFHINDEGDIFSIQCQMSLRGSESTRRVDGLSLTFIDYNVAALTLCPN
jgi:hypothetical protein